jgi:transcription elongation GreA/GreB family factor
MKTVDDRRKAVSQAISRAYGVSIWPVEISTEFAERDARDFVKKTAGSPHADLTVAMVAALTLSRAAKMPADEALASVLSDLIDGGVSLDRQAAAPRGLGELMNLHRKKRARANPLPADLRAKARETAPTVRRRSGESAVKRVPAPATAPAAAPAGLIASGHRVRYRLDDGSVHDVWLGAAPSSGDQGLHVVPLGSPVGRALLGATKGTVVPLTLGGRGVELEVLDVKKPSAP